MKSAPKNPGGVKARESCPSYPDRESHDFDEHEPMKDEMRCAYCGERLAPYPCHGCGKFLTAAEMHDAYFQGIWLCAECF